MSKALFEKTCKEIARSNLDLLKYLGTIHKRRLLKGGGRGVQKMPKKETFISGFGETRGGRVPQKSKIWGDVFYGWSLA
jgi:hypothetical protein